MNNELFQKTRFQSVPIASLRLYNIQRENLGFKNPVLEKHSYFYEKPGSTGHYRKVYRSLQVRVPRNIPKYLSIQKLLQKRSHQCTYVCKYVYTKNIFEQFF